VAAALAAATLAGCDDGGAAQRAPDGRSLTGRVVSVADGDTVRVRLGSGDTERVRYIGIDTPETEKPDAPAECYADRARAFNARLVDHRDVRLELDVEQRDRYGRLLAYVYVGDTNVGAELLRAGYAVVLTVPPNVRFAARFHRLAREARHARRGLWASCVS
jgi:micrococcal nuclease